MIAAVIGVAVGLLVIASARVVRGEHWVYSIGLITLPALYALFALRAGVHVIALRELSYGVPFLAAGLAFALLSARQSALIVGALWILHGLYDIVHDQLISNPGVPVWYPAFCFSVDVVIGVYLLWLSRRLPDASLRPATARNAA